MLRMTYILIIYAVTQISTAVSVLAQTTEAPVEQNFTNSRVYKPERFEKEIVAFETKDRNHPPAKGGILFVGSSSIRLWPVKQSFPHRTIVHRGFGGSTTIDLNFYFDRIVLPYEPKIIVYYEGDNDIGQNVSPEDTIKYTRQFIDRVHKLWPETVILYLPIKPSIKRWNLWDKIQVTHQSMRELATEDEKLVFVDIVTPTLVDGMPNPDMFQKDGLHLNEHGYEIWTPVLEAELVKYSPPTQK